MGGHVDWRENCSLLGYMTGQGGFNGTQTQTKKMKRVVSADKKPNERLGNLGCEVRNQKMWQESKYCM